MSISRRHRHRRVHKTVICVTIVTLFNHTMNNDSLLDLRWLYSLLNHSPAKPVLQFAEICSLKCEYLVGVLDSQNNTN